MLHAAVLVHNIAVDQLIAAAAAVIYMTYNIAVDQLTASAAAVI